MIPMTVVVVGRWGIIDDYGDDVDDYDDGANGGDETDDDKLTMMVMRMTMVVMTSSQTCYFLQQNMYHTLYPETAIDSFVRQSRFRRTVLMTSNNQQSKKHTAIIHKLG